MAIFDLLDVLAEFVLELVSRRGSELDVLHHLGQLLLQLLQLLDVGWSSGGVEPECLLVVGVLLRVGGLVDPPLQVVDEDFHVMEQFDQILFLACHWDVFQCMFKEFQLHSFSNEVSTASEILNRLESWFLIGLWKGLWVCAHHFLPQRLLHFLQQVEPTRFLQQVDPPRFLQQDDSTRCFQMSLLLRFLQLWSLLHLPGLASPAHILKQGQIGLERSAS